MRAIARAQPNIALIKYWGKRDVAKNLPAVGSISLTLADLYTQMTVEPDAALGADELNVNGRDDSGMLPRVARCLDTVAGPARPKCRVVSDCNFPVAAGLASSASAFAALVIAADAAFGLDSPTPRLASMAGRASGSAARSVFGGIVELAVGDHDVEVDTLLQPDEWPLRVVVAITTAARKATGSGEAMEISRKTSPFYARWVDQQAADLDEARQAIAARDFTRLGAIAEHNCLKMHSVMWASRPPLVYWNSATLECMRTVRELQEAGVAVFFTIDAGPQLKAVCLPEAEARVAAALADTPGVVEIMRTGLGAGARLLDG